MFSGQLGDGATMYLGEVHRFVCLSIYLTLSRSLSLTISLLLTVCTQHWIKIVNVKGERWEVQFKGAGQTPYSRRADGRKVSLISAFEADVVFS